ncbi:MAG: hypothetical protein AAB602_03535 [Patescibacteria group bacterium]
MKKVIIGKDIKEKEKFKAELFNELLEYHFEKSAVQKCRNRGAKETARGRAARADEKEYRQVQITCRITGEHH